jgi:hypothetical protein
MSPNTDSDRLANELIVAGALFTALYQIPAISKVDFPGDEDTAALWVWFDFMKSRYRVTVTMDPESDRIVDSELDEDMRPSQIDGSES